MTKRQVIGEACDEVSNGRIRVWRGISGNIYFDDRQDMVCLLKIRSDDHGEISGMPESKDEIKEFLETELAIALLQGGR